VVSKFDKVYEEINHFLVNSGVLPDLSVTTEAYKNSSSNSSNTSSSNSPDVTNDVETTDAGNDFLGTMRDLLTQQKSALTSSNVASENQSSALLHEPMVNDGQLVQALSKVQVDVQQQFAANDAHLSLVELRNQIGKVLDVAGPVTSQTIGQSSDDVIDIVSMLFDYILDDKNLPDEFKALIGRLQIPMLKVASCLICL